MTANVDTKQPYVKALITLVNSIDRQVNLPEEDKVLIIMQLDTEAKAKRFAEWIGQNLQGETLKLTAPEIMHQSAKIGRGKF